MRRELARARLSSCALCADAASRRSGPALAHLRERTLMYDGAEGSAPFGKTTSRPRTTHGCAGSATLKGPEIALPMGQALPLRQLLDRSWWQIRFHFESGECRASPWIWIKVFEPTRCRAFSPLSCASVHYVKRYVNQLKKRARC